jgi:type VII secretion protein EccB
MMGQPTTRLQVSGHRFLARRMEHALVRGDTRMIDDPLRAQSLSLLSGAVLAVIAVAVCAVLAFVRPGASLGDASIVVVRESGAMFVRIDDVMHPVFNLASARLIVGSAAEPRVVTQRAVDRADRGPQVGIAGAPAEVSPALRADEALWTICDDQHGATHVIAGPVTGASVTPGHSVLVTPRGESAAVTYLLHGGWRARVDLRHPAVVRALRIDGVVPQQVSRAVLDAIPEAPAIEPPQIPAAGSPGPLASAGRPVGTVVKVPQADGRVVDYYVVLADGLQRIGEVAADLIRYTDGRAGEQIATISADVVGVLPVATALPVTTYPPRGGVTSARVVCAQWNPQAGETASHTQVLSGNEIPAADRSITLAQADGDGAAIDTVAIPAGRSVFARAVGLTGSGRTAGSLFLVADSGVVYGVWDDETATALGLADPAVPAPWPVLAHLPRGPELSRRAASIARDGLGTAP